MYRGKAVGVVVPAYNEERFILSTLKAVPDFVDRVFAVDDASTDGTLALMESLKSPRLTVISHPKNMGVGAAIVSGYKAASDADCDVVAVMAGDGQMDPAELPRLLDPVVDGDVDYSKGNRLLSRKIRQGMPRFRLLGNSILTFLTKLSSGYWNIMDPQNGYAAISKHVIDTLPLDELFPRYGYPNDMLVKLNTYGFRVTDVIMHPRYGLEKSKIRIWNYIPTVSNLLLRGFIWRMKEKYVLQSLHPLIFFYIMGITLLPLGIMSAIYILYLRLVEGGITAASVLIPIFLIIVGFQSVFFAMLFDMEAAKR